ncbi:MULTISPECIES: hypothetical protein [unclassified Desulfovibrio]|uniref:hypothetical protein n=1 Tax=unclassified Desulfovibrio TaxID=2593640 RepID=UPI002FD8F810
MSRDPLLKVYGHIYPVDREFYDALARACADALPDETDIPVIEMDGDMARFSFEGAYFPVEETLEALAHGLKPEHKGKLDVLDLEGWRLTRHVFEAGRIKSSSASLNNVLDYSGH